jgi:hypothetical protein
MAWNYVFDIPFTINTNQLEKSKCKIASHISIQIYNSNTILLQICIPMYKY